MKRAERKQQKQQKWNALAERASELHLNVEQSVALEWVKPADKCQ